MATLWMSCGNTAERNRADQPELVRPRTLVAGLGNPILGDDGIGWRVAETVRERLPEIQQKGHQVDVACFALGGLSLMEQMAGYERAIIIDALQTRGGKPGQVYRLVLADLPDYSAGHMTAAHDTSLPTALRLGRAMGVALPEQILIVGIEAQRVYDFSEELSPAVAAAIPEAARTVLKLLAGEEERGTVI